MSLLDDVSIVVTPNGYKAGELYAVLPTYAEGADKVTDGDFPLPNVNWTVATGWAIAGNEATCSSGNSSLTQDVSAEIGKQYKVTFDISTFTSGTLYTDLGGASGQTTTTTGSKTFYFTATSTGLLRFYGGAFRGSIGNVIVKEVTSADMDVTRATAATRVDENGLVNYAEIIGSDLVTNGDFATDLSGWSNKSSTSTWVSGSARVDNSIGNNNSGLFQDIGLILDKTYTLTATLKLISADSDGNFVVLTSNSIGSGQTIIYTGNALVIGGASVTETIEFTTSDSDVSIQLACNATNAVFEIDNVSVKEVTRDNVPRIDYTGGGCPHILSEPQRKNEITYSEDFTDSSWVKTNVDVSNNTELAPNGTETATRAIISSTGTDLRTQCNVIESTNYTFTFYAKKGTSTDITYRVYDVSNGSNIVSPTNYFSQVGIDWQRVELNFTTPSGCTSVLVYLSSDSAVVGDIYLWGVQLEQGSYATSYIPTSGGTVTRNQDIFTRDGIGSLIGQTEGTFFIELSKPVLSPDNYITISLNNAASNSIDNTLTIGFKNSNEYYIRLRAGGTSAFTSGNTASLANTFYKIAVSYKSTESLIYIDGNPITPNGGNLSNAFAFTATLDNLSFDLDGDNTSPFYGNVRQLQVYDTALSATQLAALTS